MKVGLDIGLGLHLSEIDTNDAEVQERSRLILWTLELFYAFSLACAKLSILAFYWRMFKSSNLKTPIYVLTACAIIWLILRVSQVKMLQVLSHIGSDKS